MQRAEEAREQAAAEVRRSRKRSRKKNDQKFFLFVFATIILGIAAAALLSVFFPAEGQESKKEKAQPASAQAQAYTPSSATWTAAGDIVFHLPFLESGVYLNSSDGSYNYNAIFDYCRPLLEEADFSTVTMETSLAGEEAGYSGYPMFKAPDALADALAATDIWKDDDDPSNDWIMMFSGYEGMHFATEGQYKEVYTGGVRYNNNDRVGEMCGYVLVQVQDGDWTVVYPESYNGDQTTIHY